MTDRHRSPPSAGQPAACHVIEVTVEHHAWSRTVAGVTDLCCAAARAALVPRTDPVEVSILLADDGRLQALNRAYRGVDRPTNVLAFAADAAGQEPPLPPRPPGAECLLGDIVVAYRTTCAEAADQGLPLAHHLSHLVVHGTLHLLGYDHQSDADAAVMEAHEAAVLARLGVADPYARVVA